MKRLMLISLTILCFCCNSCTGVPENTENDNAQKKLETIAQDIDVKTEDIQISENNTEDGAFGNDIENNVEVYPIKLIRTDGKLYYDTGENSYMTPRCGTLDGDILSVCDEYSVPKQDGEANFENTDYYGSGWQNATDDTKEIPTEDGWRIFKKIKVDSILVYEYKSCMRVVGKDFEEIILSSEEPVLDNDGNAVYAEKKIGEKRLTLPVKYGTVYDWGIEMYAKDVTAVGMTLVIKQSGGNIKGEINTGTPYELYVWNGSFWERQPYCEGIGNVAWNMPAYNIPTGSEREFEINWEWLYGTLPAGKYRISKELMDFKAGTDHDKHTYYLEFEIPEIMICENLEADDEASDENVEICGYPRYEDMKE